MSRFSKGGLTLIELILAILILGVIAPAVFTVMATVTRSYALSEHQATAGSLGRGLLDEILAKKFDEQMNLAGGVWSVLGPESGESPTGTGAAEYDDVDDYQGYADAPAGFVGFSRSVQVVYVQPAQIVGGWQFNGTANPSAEPYKRVTVTVNGPGGVTVALVGLATRANSEGGSW